MHSEISRISSVGNPESIHGHTYGSSGGHERLPPLEVLVGVLWEERRESRIGKTEASVDEAGRAGVGIVSVGALGETVEGERIENGTSVLWPKYL